MERASQSLLSNLQQVGQSYLRLSQLSLLSLAVSFFGNRRGNKQTLQKVLRLYGSTLNDLNSTLSDPTCVASDEVFVSVIALSLLECFVPSGKRSWLNNMIGLEKLFELRGPSAYSSLPK